MATQLRMTNPPIFEAILDFRFNVPEGVGIDHLKKICDEMAQEFPERELQHEFEALLDIKDIGGAPIKTKQSLSGFVLRSSDKSKAVIVRRNGCTASHVGRYTSWEDLEAQARKLFEVFVSETSAQGVTRVAARFINHIPLKEGLIDLDEILTHGPKVPAGVPELLFIFESKIGINEEASGLQAIVGQGMAEPRAGKGRVIVIDSDVFKVGSFSPQFSELSGTLADIRDLKNRIFFGSVTDRALEPFK